MSHKVCVIGAGYWGKNHIRTLYELGALGGIVEQNKELLGYYSAQYPDAKTYQNLDDALENKDFAGFTVATPSETHYDIAATVIRAKKHVLVEKPLSLNIGDAKHLVSLSKKYQVNLMDGHILLFHPAIQLIKSLIHEGKIGIVQYIYSNRLNFGQARTQENVLWSLAPHDISIFQYFTESYPEDLKVNGSTFLQKGIHDSIIMQLKYPNGVEGHIFVSWLHPFKEHRLVVIGSEAMITFEDSAEGKPLKLYSKKFDMENGLPEKIDGPVELIDYEQKMPLTEKLNYFVNHLDKKQIVANGQHALEVTKILFEADRCL